MLITMASVWVQTANLKAALTALQGQVGSLVDSLNEENTMFMDAVQVEFAKQRLGLEEVVISAQAKLLGLEARRRCNEKTGGATGGEKGLLPDKMMVPEKFSDVTTHWQKWKGLSRSH